MTATAVIDRLVHHGAVFAFAGQSHRRRTREKPPKNAYGSQRFNLRLPLGVQIESAVSNMFDGKVSEAQARRARRVAMTDLGIATDREEFGAF